MSSPGSETAVGHFCWSAVHFCPFKKQGLGHRASTCPTPCVRRASRLSVTFTVILPVLISCSFKWEFQSTFFFFFFLQGQPSFIASAHLAAFAAAGFCYDSGERAWRSEWSFHFLFLEKCCLYYKEEIKVINPLEKHRGLIKPMTKLPLTSKARVSTPESMPVSLSVLLHSRVNSIEKHRVPVNETRFLQEHGHIKRLGPCVCVFK